MAAGSFRKNGVFGAQFHSPLKSVLPGTVCRYAHIARGNTNNPVFLVDQNLAG